MNMRPKAGNGLQAKIFKFIKPAICPTCTISFYKLLQQPENVRTWIPLCTASWPQREKDEENAFFWHREQVIVSEVEFIDQIV